MDKDLETFKKEQDELLKLETDKLKNATSAVGNELNTQIKGLQDEKAGLQKKVKELEGENGTHLEQIASLDADLERLKRESEELLR